MNTTILFLSLLLIGVVSVQGDEENEEMFATDVFEQTAPEPITHEDAQQEEEAPQNVEDGPELEEMTDEDMMEPEVDEDSPEEEAEDEIFESKDQEDEDETSNEDLNTETNSENKEDDETQVSSQASLPSSCAQIKRKNPRSRSKYYLLSVGGKKIRQYCYMDRLCGLKGWTRLATFNMDNKQAKCPSSLKQYITAGKRHCGRKPSIRGGCSSVKIPSRGIPYKTVCGKVIGVQFYTTDGARKYRKYAGKAYLDGVSITQGYPRKHVWSFYSARSEMKSRDCPCFRGSNVKTPSFVGNNYFCESGFFRYLKKAFAISDLLWDGKKCRSRERMCCNKRRKTLRFLPYFRSQLKRYSSKYLELRVCTDERTSNENVSIRQYEFYVR